MVWRPAETCIVLGSSNTAATAVHVELVEAEGIPVFKRPSGGQTVILTPETLVISIRFFSESLDNPRTYFRKINRLIMAGLAEIGIVNLVEKGISDIAIGGRKILGSSIYRKKKMVLYHAVLNVSESAEKISRYLKHPVREPEYRAGREHGEFVTSLLLSGNNQDIEIIKQTLQRVLAENLSSAINEKLVF
jgi:lipoate-protein ligase A